jgi:hypothetical protein
VCMMVAVFGSGWFSYTSVGEWVGGIGIEMEGRYGDGMACVQSCASNSKGMGACTCPGRMGGWDRNSNGGTVWGWNGLRAE